MLKTTGIILAGGKSSRMGTNKALLPLHGKTVIERIVERMRGITDELMIVTNTFEDYAFLRLPMTADHWPGMGPLAGLEAGLSRSRTDYNLITACDMPFISVELGRYLLSCLDQYQAAVPVIKGRQHPLFAAYRKEIVAEVRNALEKQELRMEHFLKTIHVKMITEELLVSLGLPIEESCFFNMNKFEHYQKAKSYRIP